MCVAELRFLGLLIMSFVKELWNFYLLERGFLIIASHFKMALFGALIVKSHDSAIPPFIYIGSS